MALTRAWYQRNRAVVNVFSGRVGLPHGASSFTRTNTYGSPKPARPSRKTARALDDQIRIVGKMVARAERTHLPADILAAQSALDAVRAHRASLGLDRG